MEQLLQQLSMQVSYDRAHLLFLAASAIVCKREIEHVCAVLFL